MPDPDAFPIPDGPAKDWFMRRLRRIHPVRAAVVVGQAAWAVSCAGLFQFQGSSSCRRDAGWSLIRRRTSASRIRPAGTAWHF